MPNMTRAAMLRIARKARDRGYFQSQTPFKLWVNCPECGERVEAHDYSHDYRNHRRRTTVQMLDAAMLTHLTDYCGEEE